MAVAPTHGVVRIKKDNRSEVCGIVSGTYQVRSECCLLGIIAVLTSVVHCHLAEGF